MVNKMRRMNQEGAEGTTNVQAGRDVVAHYGLTPAEATEIAYTIFEQNFPALTERAESIARERADSLIKGLFKRLLETNTPLGSFSDPDVQYSLMVAERDF